MQPRQSAQEVIQELAALKQRGIAPELQVFHLCTHTCICVHTISIR